MVGTSIVAIVFLQISNALRAGRMIRSDSLLYVIGRKRPKIAHGMEAAFAVLGVGFFCAIVYAATPLVVESIKAQTFIGVQGFFTMPIWPVRTIIVTGCLLMAAQYVRLSIDKIGLARAGAPWHGDVPE